MATVCPAYISREDVSHESDGADFLPGHTSVGSSGLRLDGMPVSPSVQSSRLRRQPTDLDNAPLLRTPASSGISREAEYLSPPMDRLLGETAPYIPSPDDDTSLHMRRRSGNKTRRTLDRSNDSTTSAVIETLCERLSAKSENIDDIRSGNNTFVPSPLL